MVDIARPTSVARNKKLKQAAYAVAGVTALLLITVFVSRLKPAAPTVERATVWVDTVKRGPMVRQVRGTGTLVPEETRWLPATTDGVVDRIVLRPGAVLRPESVILELSNPELQQSLIESRLQLESARAQLENRRSELQSAVRTQEAATATVQADARQARLQAEADALLAKDGLTSELTMKISESRAANLETRYTIEAEQLNALRLQLGSQLAVQESEVNRLETLYELRARQVAELRVRAGVSGVLQLVPVEQGTRVTPGTNLARVADPGRLKAELRIAETQAKDIQIGQRSQVDTRNGIIEGRVARIDPAAQNGTVLVDIALEGELPRGARPDLTVDGTVELERLDEVVFVGRPAFGQEQSTVGLFKLLPTGEATRVQVKLGRSSVNTIEIVEGLQPGDEVILSDMSQWDAFDRVRLGS